MPLLSARAFSAGLNPGAFSRNRGPHVATIARSIQILTAGLVAMLLCLSLLSTPVAVAQDEVPLDTSDAPAAEITVPPPAVITPAATDPLPGGDPSQGADGTSRVDVDIIQTNPSQRTDEPDTYLSGENINLLFHLDVSGNKTLLPRAKVTLRLSPNPYADKTFDPAHPQLAQSCEYNLGKDNQTHAPKDSFANGGLVIECYYDSIRGAESFEVPVGFKFKNQITPPGSEVTAEFILEFEGQTEPIRKTLVLKSAASYNSTVNIQYFRHDSQSSGVTEGGQRVEQAGKYHPKFDPAQPEPQTSGETGIMVGHKIQARFHSVGDNPEVGFYAPRTAKLTLPLPEGASWPATRSGTFPQKNVRFDNSVWQYDEATRSVSQTVDIASVPERCKIGADTCAYDTEVFFLYQNTPLESFAGFAKRFYPTTVELTPDPTGDKAPTAWATDWVTFARPPRPIPFRQWGNAAITKTYVKQPRTELFENLYGDTANVNTPPVFLWQLQVSATNNGDGSTAGTREDPPVNGHASRIISIVDNELDREQRRERFSAISLGRHGGNSNILFASNFGASQFTPEEIQKQFFDAEPHLFGTTAEGEVRDLGPLTEEHLYPRKFEFPQDEIFHSWEIKFNEEFVLDNGILTFGLETQLVDSEISRWKENPELSSEQYKNRAALSYRMPHNAPEISQKRTEEVFHQIDRRVRRVSLTPGKDRVAVQEECDRLKPNQPCRRHVEITPKVSVNSVRSSHDAWDDASYKGEQAHLAVILPEGAEFVRHRYSYLRTATFRDKDGKPLSIAPPPAREVHNFRNTGKTALVIDFPPFDSRIRSFEPTLTIDVTPSLDPLENEVEYFHWWTASDVLPNTDSGTTAAVPDKLDLNDDGDTEELVLRTTSRLSINLAAETLARTHIRPSNAHAWLLEHAYIDIGSPVEYRLTYMNNSPRPVTELDLVQVLPNHKGDTAFASNQDGLYPVRTWSSTTFPDQQENSAFNTPLTRPLEDTNTKEINDLFEFWYSTTPSLTEEYATDSEGKWRDGIWLSKEAITDWSTVTAVRATLRPGRFIPGKDPTPPAGATMASPHIVRIFTSNEIPFDEHTRSKDLGYRAVTSNSSKTNVNSHFLESNNVSPETVSYSVNGVVFLDRNEDGIYNQSQFAGENREVPLAGYWVTLYDNEGKRAVYPNCRPIPAQQTDENGKYNFKVYTRGTYKVGFSLKPDNRVFTTYGKLPNQSQPISNQVERQNIVSGVNQTQGQLPANCTPAKNIDDFAGPIPPNELAGYTNTTVGFSHSFTLDPERRTATRHAGVRSIVALPDTGGPGVFGFAAIALLLSTAGAVMAWRRSSTRA